MRPLRSDRWWAAGLGLAALVLYLVTLAPSVATVFDDSLEFQVVLPSLGIAHPTGYPSYTILGWLFSRLPIGDLAYRVNLLSGLFAAATVFLLYLAARRLGSSLLAATIASITFALSFTWWSQSTIAEVYTLHGLFVAALLLLVLAGSRLLPWLALAFGLALTHHRMTLLLVPGLLVYVLWNNPGLLRRPRQVMGLLLLLLLPLLLYLYLPLRGLATTSLDGNYTNTWQGFWRHVLALDYGAFLSDNPLAVETPSNYPLNLFVSQFGLVVLLLGLFGWMRWADQPRRWTMLALVFAANIAFAIGYRTADADVFYIPATLVWLLLAAVGLTTLLDSLGASLAAAGRRLRLPGRYQTWFLAGQIAVTAVVLFQPLQSAARSLDTSPRPRTCAEVLAVGEPPALSPNRSREWSTYNCGKALLSLPLPRESAVIGLLGEITLLRYFQMAEGLRTDVLPITADQEVDRLAAVERQLGEGRAVYLTRELAGAPERYSLTAEGPLVRVWPPGEAEPAPLAEDVDVPFGDSLRLVGYELAPIPARNATLLRLKLAWNVETAVGEDLKVSARLLDPEGRIVSSHDRVPVHWAYPTTAWRPGETVVDSYDFALPAGTAVDRLTPLVILYRAADGTEVGRYQPASPAAACGSPMAPPATGCPSGPRWQLDHMSSAGRVA